MLESYYGQSVPITHQLSGLNSCSLGEPELFPMTLASLHSQILPLTGAISLSRISLRGAIILSGLAEEAFGLFLAAFRPFVAILSTFKARLSCDWAFTDILAIPVAQTHKAAPCVHINWFSGS